MRKLFVLALIACIVPFAVGCKIDGLWGYEDNDPVNQSILANRVALSSRIAVPTDGIDPAIRAKLAAANFQVMVGDKAITFNNTGTSGTNTVLSFAQTFNATDLGFTSTTTSKEFVVKILYNNFEIYSFTVTLSATAASAATDADNTITITFNKNPDEDNDGLLDNATGISVTVQTPAGTFTPTATQKALPAFCVTKQEVWVNGQWKVLSGYLNSPTSLGVNSLNGLKFRVTFSTNQNNLSTNTAFSVTVNNLTTTGTPGQTVTSGQGQITIVPVNDKLAAEISFVNQHDIVLSNTGIYKISINETDLATTGNPAEALNTTSAAYFKP